MHKYENLRNHAKENILERVEFFAADMSRATHHRGVDHAVFTFEGGYTITLKKKELDRPAYKKLKMKTSPKLPN